MSTVTFKPKQITKKITNSLPDRNKDVIMNRYGLTADARRRTLEEIGKKYGITRERVRQIENSTFNLIKKSEHFLEEQSIFDELKSLIKSLGSMVSEQDFLQLISKDKSIQNHIHFFLHLGDYFKKHSDDENFKVRWSIDDELANKIHESLRRLYSKISNEDLIPESEMIKRFLDELKDVLVETEYLEPPK